MKIKSGNVSACRSSGIGSTTVFNEKQKLNKLFNRRAMNVKQLFWQTHC
jgi:hypothetical protein